MKLFARRQKKHPSNTPVPVPPAAAPPTNSSLKNPATPANLDPAATLPGTSVGVPTTLAKLGVGSWYLIGIVIFVSMIVWATAQIAFVFTTIFLALVATSVLRPITDFFAKWMPRVLAMIVALLLTFGIFAGLMTFVVLSVRGEWENLASEFSTGLDSLLDLLENNSLPWSVSQEEANQWISEQVDNGIAWVQENAGEISSTVMSSAGAIGVIIMVLSIAALATVFFLLSGAKMWLWFINELPENHRDITHRAATAGWLAFSGYARGTIIIGLINGILAFLLLLVLGVPLAAPLAVLVVIGTFIPLFGAPIAMFIATIVAFAVNGPIIALVVLLGIALIGQLEGDLFQPLIMGRTVSLHPVVIALGVTAGTFLAGLLGAVIAIPILSVIWAVYKVIRHQDPPRKELPSVDKDELLKKD